VFVLKSAEPADILWPVRGDTTKVVDQEKVILSSEMKTSGKLEKSRQSARECRARKKLRYQYLDDLILERERANERLRGEMSKYLNWCTMIDQNTVPDNVQQALNNSIEETQN